jgi:glutamine cyclotransferase
LYESTGSPESPTNNGSWLGIVDLKTGKADKKVTLTKNYFGEGISIMNGKIYQLTYQNNVGFVYDSATYKKIKEFNYPGEGWSLTNDGQNLIMSDGTNKLQYLDPETLKVIKSISVEDNNGPVANINELELIKGFIYANVWLSNYILKIDPSTGQVLAKLDFSNLASEVKRKYTGSNEFNGIAYDAQTDKIYVTGKLWPNLYEVKF